MVDDGKLSTNIDALDEGTLGGIPKGSTIALVVDPKTMGNLVMVRLANTGRRTHYTTVNRDVKSVNTK